MSSLAASLDFWNSSTKPELGMPVGKATKPAPGFATAPAEHIVEQSVGQGVYRWPSSVATDLKARKLEHP